MSSFQKNVIITGIPRSGTTLTGALFDSLSNCVCLSEPKQHTKWALEYSHREQFVRRLVQDFADVRNHITSKRPVMDNRSSDGTPVTNYVKRNKKGKPIDIIDCIRPIVFDIKDENFLLGMKHNAHYTSVLPLLAKKQDFSIIAVVRHPIPTILSWQTLNMPVSNGRMPTGENFWPELKKITNSNEEILLKQVKIYDLFCRRYLALQKYIHLLKYETLTTDPLILEQLTGKTYKREVKADNRNQSSYYNFSLSKKITDLISRYAPHALQLYGKEL